MKVGQRRVIETRLIGRLLSTVLVVLMSGCSLSPAIPVLGAAFPSWLFCLFGAAILLIICHILIVRRQWQQYFSPLVVSYSGLLFLFAVVLWFLFFVN